MGIRTDQDALLTEVSEVTGGNVRVDRAGLLTATKQLGAGNVRADAAALLLGTKQLSGGGVRTDAAALVILERVLTGSSLADQAALLLLVPTVAVQPPSSPLKLIQFATGETAQLLPITNAPNQTLLATLNVDGQVVTRQLFLHYNEMANYWVLTIADSVGNVILSGVPLITGQVPAGNLLAQFAYLGLGGLTVINAGGVPEDYPNNTDLGTQFELIWYNSQES